MFNTGLLEPEEKKSNHNKKRVIVEINPKNMTKI